MALLSGLVCYSQKEIINPSVYNSWKSIGERQLSNDGKYVTYTIKPYKGDGYLYIQNLLLNKVDSIFKGYACKISSNSSFAVFKIHPGYDTLHSAELKEKKSDLWPKDELAVYNLRADSIRKFGKIKSFELAEQGNTLVYLGTENKYPKEYLTKKEAKALAKTTKKNGTPKSDGKLLSILDLASNQLKCFTQVKEYTLSKSGRYVAFLQHTKYKRDSLRLNVYDLESKNHWQASKQVLELTGLNFSGEKEDLFGLFTRDTASDKKWSLFRYSPAKQVYDLLIDTNKVFENNQVLSKNFTPYLNNNDKDLFFGIAAMPDKPFKDTLLEREKVVLDIWSWEDKRIQPEQLKEFKNDLNKTNLTVLHLDKNEFVVLGNDSLQLQYSSKRPQKFILATCNEASMYKSWEYPFTRNYYLIRVSDGKIIPEYQNQSSAVHLSPYENYLCFWNENSRAYYIRNRNTEKETCVSCGTKQNLVEDINGMIYQPQPLGIIGWGNHDEYLFIEAEKALLMYDISAQKLINFTATLQKNERDTNYTYRVMNLSTDSVSFYPENTIIVQTDKISRDQKVFSIENNFISPTFKLLATSPHYYGAFLKAKNNKRILFTRSSVKDYPNYFTIQADSVVQLTNANPQQANYNWATVEVVKWKSYSGINLEGLLYKPENYNENNNYPLLTYYYELNSENLHTHYAPRPTASIIFPTEYASAGYLVFIPDIRYTAGHPANSAYDCIMSGVDAVLETYPNIDKKRLGLQGQSWGGYQTAQLITMTNRFKCAMAGAPVSNMFSAYGGIRWGSGFSRQFQYEHTQSRIGKNIWQAPELYVENSPLFGLPKVNTALLIMHNDNDGAVPWYQGIELYMGLRRLQKPVWLLNYNGDEHNLMKPANRMDLSIRMRQFFDYYLLNAAEPLWMKVGIQATKKGKTLNYQLEE